MVRPSLPVLAAIASLLVVSPAAGADPPAGHAKRTSSLAWVREPGAEACVDGRALALAVERRLGRSAIAAVTVGDLAIEGRVERREQPASWRAIISVADASGARVGVRELSSDKADCHALDDEISLVISLLIDPEAALAAPPPAGLTPITPWPPQAAPPACPPASKPPPPAPAPAPAPPPAPSWRLAAEGALAIGLGSLPTQPAGGFLVRVRAEPPRGPSFEIGAGVWLDNHVALGSSSATFSLAYGSIALCPLDVAAAGNTLSACAGARFGSLRVGDVPAVYQQESVLIDLTIDARARRRLAGPLLAIAGVGISVPSRRDQFFYVDAAGTRRDVFRAAPVGGTLEIGLGLEIP